MTDLQPLGILKPLKKNPKRETKRGHDLLHTSLESGGAGRSVLIDNENVILAGNSTFEAFGQLVDNPKVLIVETDGDVLVAVKRRDIPNASDPKAQALIIGDNRASDFHEYDLTVLADYDADIVGNYWFSNELAALEDRADPLDYDSHWRGMPEFSQEDASGFHKLTLHFASEQDMKDFAVLVGQAITDKTTYLWIPKQERQSLLSKRIIDES